MTGDLAIPSSRTKRDLVDERWMDVALELAHRASSEGLRPFGCVIVDNRLRSPLALTYGSEAADDPTRHSEVLGIREACGKRGGLLHDCTLYSTHEPCTMCAGAICHAKLSRVVFGSYRHDLQQLFRPKLFEAIELLNDTTTPVAVHGGVLRARCVALFDEEVAEYERLHSAG